jgi:hypothetical protein
MAEVRAPQNGRRKWRFFGGIPGGSCIEAGGFGCVGRGGERVRMRGLAD